MALIDLVDQTFRDGQQSLWGMRLRAGMVTGVARELDSAGFSAIDITGSSMFECVMRYSRDLRNTVLAAHRHPVGAHVGTGDRYSVTPDEVIIYLMDEYGGRSISDEELLLRYMVPAEDIEAVRAAGPLPTDYDFTDVHSLPQLVAHLQGLQRTRSVSGSGPDYRFAFQRG